jgi:hypothetical protein
MWNVEFEVWNVKCGVRNLEFGIEIRKPRAES